MLTGSHHINFRFAGDSLRIAEVGRLSLSLLDVGIRGDRPNMRVIEKGRKVGELLASGSHSQVLFISTKSMPPYNCGGPTIPLPVVPT